MEQALAKQAPEPGAVNWDKAKMVAQEARGIPVPVSPDSPDLTDVLTPGAAGSKYPTVGTDDIRQGRLENPGASEKCVGWQLPDSLSLREHPKGGHKRIG